MKILPLFPLQLVVYPGEDLNLHIFEPRYKQLINECLEEQRTFGIPTFLKNKVLGFGTEMHITALHKCYPDGRMDISTKGIRVFEVHEFWQPMPNRLYAGGEVSLRPAAAADYSPYTSALVERVNQLYAMLRIEVDYEPTDSLFSYRIAHKIGLSIEQEYELLTIPTEPQRQQFLIKHIDNVLPVIAEIERTKERIKLNGHFRNLDPLDF